MVCRLEGSSDVDTLLDVDCVVVNRSSVKFSVVGTDVAANTNKIINIAISSSC